MRYLWRVEMKIDLIPFTVPNFVTGVMPPKSRQEGPYVDSPKWALADVPEEDLSKLCDNFRAEVFSKAGKTDPKKMRT